MTHCKKYWVMIHKHIKDLPEEKCAGVICELCETGKRNAEKDHSHYRFQQEFVSDWLDVDWEDERNFLRRMTQTQSLPLRELWENGDTERINQILSVNSEKIFLQRLRELKQNNGFGYKIFNVWNFASCDPRFGKPGYPGRVPGQILQNIFHYFLYDKTDALIVDPMAGSGTTHDVVLWWNDEHNTRHSCLSYDIRTPRFRDFITIHDINLGYPEDAQNCDLIFLDPYYYDMITGEFKSWEQYDAHIINLAENSFTTIKQGGLVCLLMADRTKNDGFIHLRGHAYLRFARQFNAPIAVISVPHTTEQYPGDEMARAKEEHRILGIDRTLFVWRREP